MTKPRQSARMARERDDSGQYVETVGPDDVLDVFAHVDGPPVITSTDVAGALDCTTEAARQKLQRLVDDGVVERRKSGRTVLYWRVDDPEAGSGRADVEGEERPDSGEGTGEDTGDALEDRSLRERIRAADWGSYAATDDRIDAIAAAARHLREEGEAPMGDLAEVADTAGGETWEELSPGSKGGRRKLLGKVLAQVGGDSGGRGASPWTWTGGDN